MSLGRLHEILLANAKIRDDEQMALLMDGVKRREGVPADLYDCLPESANAEDTRKVTLRTEPHR